MELWMLFTILAIIISCTTIIVTVIGNKCRAKKEEPECYSDYDNE